MCTGSAMHAHVGMQTPGSHCSDLKISNRAVINYTILFRTCHVTIAWHELKQIYHDKSLFSQQTTCLNYGKICTRQAGRVRGQPNLPVFFPTRIMHTV